MLLELQIENVAVIERTALSLGAGLNILTGETGAGKSMIVDSLHAVLGGRTSRELVRTGAEKAVICAIFDPAPAEEWCRENEIDVDDELIIRRQISVDGKTSCRVCGVPVTTAQLRELGSLLLDIHGQNDGQQLLDERQHQRYLDAFGVSESVLEAYRKAYREYLALVKEQETLRGLESEKELLTDSLRHQIQELEQAELKAGEEAELTEKRDLLRNFEKLSEAVETAYELLEGGEENAVSLAAEAESAAIRAAGFAAELAEVPTAIHDAVFSLQDAAETLRDFRAGLDFSEAEYDRIENRLAVLRRLERKYHADEDGLIQKLSDARERLDQIEYADDRLLKLERLIAAKIQEVLAAGKSLSEARRSAAVKLEKQVVSELRDLAMPGVRFQVELAPVSGQPGFGPAGTDTVRFLLSANAGEAPGRISKIASGGELSRIMLALKNVFARRDRVPSMVFDEVDTGVSGVAAQRVGEKLANLAADKQVICITHLPQIAAMADHHYLIEKTVSGGKTRTEVHTLDPDGACREIARLHGGDHVTELTLASAREQLAAAAEYKTSVRNRKGGTP